MGSRTDALRSVGWGLLWLVGAVWLWFSIAGSPVDDLRLMLYGKTTHGQIVDTWEDAEEGDDGQLHWSSAVVFTFTLPDGREIKSVSKGSNQLLPELAELKNPIPIEVEYLPSRPSINRLEGDGSQSFVHWLWRTALGIFLLALFASPGFKLARDGLMELRASSEPSGKSLQ
jgi:hypothetical protein